ncbi:hypothetical protein GOP47_0026349 [Adiantum capillus-veneris]|nr:hypothetical protein GOP47_0026349 [Adiantum capillus-veneris]
MKAYLRSEHGCKRGGGSKEHSRPKPIGRGSGKSQIWGHLRHGYSLVRGARHKMEDFHVAEFRQVASHEVGLFAIFDGHPGCNVARYLQCNLFDNILNEPGFWEDPVNAI